jgi:hypothetical protein
MRYFKRSPRSRIRRPSGAMVVAMIALIVALGGTAQALPGVNTIFTDDIVDGQVRGPDIGIGAVRAPEIGIGAVGTSEIASSGVGASEIAANAVDTSELAAGSVRAGDMGTITSRQVILSIPAGSANLAIASCNAGEIVLSGSANMAPVTNQLVGLSGSFKSSNTAWEGSGYNNDAVAHNLVVTAHCLAP